MTEREEQAVIVLNTLYNNPLLSDIHRQALEVGIMAIKAANSSENPKIGYWEWNQYDANPKIGNFHCSLCHSIGRSYFDYCPYCGAKMSEIPTGAEGERMNEQG